eukprot:11222547-Lingulodinium_polyedra.AAC.1
MAFGRSSRPGPARSPSTPTSRGAPATTRLRPSTFSRALPNALMACARSWSVWAGPVGTSTSSTRTRHDLSADATWRVRAEWIQQGTFDFVL